jgi:hypothetical protein
MPAKRAEVLPSGSGYLGSGNYILPSFLHPSLLDDCPRMDRPSSADVGGRSSTFPTLTVDHAEDLLFPGGWLEP